MFPMLFCGKIQRPRIRASPQPKLSGFKQLLIADAPVGREHFRFTLFERFGYSFAHDADTVHCVYERLSGGFEKTRSSINKHGFSAVIAKWIGLSFGRDHGTNRF